MPTLMIAAGSDLFYFIAPKFGKDYHVMDIGYWMLEQAIPGLA